MKKALIVGVTNPKIDNISSAQLYPFFNNRKLLKQELGLTFRVAQADRFSEIEEICKENLDEEIIFIRPTWREHPSDAEKTLKAIREQNPDRKLIFIDPFDQTTSRYFGVLPYVDWFLKYQRFKDLSEYRKPLIGGTKITDYLAREWGYELADWHVGSEVPAGYEHRIISGWNIGIDKRFKRQFHIPRFLSWAYPAKSIDVFCRLSFGSLHNQEWYGKYRMVAVDTLKKLAPDYKLAVSGEFDETKVISSRQYFHDIKRSRIVFSPFGWGETTWRDYEALCYNCLLIKPDISHVDTQPNIYIEGETYVPVKWDLSDLEEKCRYYLERPEAAAQIIENARQAYAAYFEQHEFVKTIQHLIDRKPSPVGVTQPLVQYEPDAEQWHTIGEELTV